MECGERGRVPGRVLIVDDEWIVAKTLDIIFTRAGYETRTADSAEEALLAVSDESWVPGFALLDVRLPGMNGLELAALLKKLCPCCTVALFSGDSSTTDLLDLAAVQGQSYEVMAKPVPPAHLLQLAERALQREERGTGWLAGT